ncbi:MAG: LPS-assembly protein LptD [Myxococcales bacterium]
MPAPQLAEPAELTTVRAELGEVSLTENLLRGEGGVVLESGGLLLRADLLEYDYAARAGIAAGNLVLVDGNVVLFAGEGSFSLGAGRKLTIRDATLLQKRAVQAPSAVASMSAADIRRAGENQLILKAEEIERIARSRFVARRLETTSCDCGEDCKPDWSVSASSADIEPGERAILRWPTFRVRGLPVLVLPAMYLPLSDRRSGLLMPQLSLKNGFGFDQPLFIVLGESYDLTLTLGARIGKKPEDGKRPQMLGPRASAELRYAPVEGTSGQLFVAAMNDRHGEPADIEPRGWRGELGWRHGTETKGGLGLRADARFVSDAYYVTDEAADVLGASVLPYVRSQAHAFWRSDWALLSLSTIWYQERGNRPWTMDPDRTLRFGAKRRLFGADSPVAFQRPLALRLEVPQLRLLGPLRGGVEIAAAHYRPVAFGGELSAERLRRSFAAAGEASADSALPLTLSRLDLRPSLALTLLGRGPLRAEAYAAARVDLSAYAPAVGEGSRFTDAWGRATAGVWAGTELSRVYGEGEKALRHSITPRLELRASTPELGERHEIEGFLAAVDEHDFYQRAADPALLQGIASVTTRLTRKHGGDLLRLEVGQGVDFGARALGDAFGRLDVGTRFATLGTGARFDVEAHEFVAVGARLALRDGRGDSLTFGYDRLSAKGTDRMRAGLDDLFGPAAIGEARSFDQITVGTSVRLWDATLRYGVTLLPMAEDKVLAHTGGVTLGSASGCWKLDLWASYVPKAESPLHFYFTLELKNLGSFGD